MLQTLKIVYEVAFVPGAYTGAGVIHRDYHDYNGYLYGFVMKETQVHYKLLIFQIYQIALQLFMIQIHYFKRLIIFLLIQLPPNYMLVQ